MPKTEEKRGAALVCLHRFQDCAALSILKAKGTIYLDAKAAADLARDLNRLARSIKAESFVSHTFKAAISPAAFPAICKALRGEVLGLLRDIETSRKERAKLAAGDVESFWFYPSEKLKAAFCEGAELKSFPA